MNTNETIERKTFGNPAPSDETCAKAWDEIMRIARDHCLIVDAYGGIATLAMPEDQRTAGVRARVLNTHRRDEVAS